ncbi:MAG: hypothetical protein J0I45_21865 [Bosea sp.]|nr:hypothetical protein [Bosea sp. (in: a-proteobacteria)]
MITAEQLHLLEVVAKSPSANGGWTHSNYIRHALIREVLHDRSAPIPSSTAVRRRLMELASLSLIKQSSYAIGLYGYGWKLTLEGQAALSEKATP